MVLHFAVTISLIVTNIIISSSNPSNAKDDRIESIFIRATMKMVRHFEIFSTFPVEKPLNLNLMSQ